MLSANVTRPVAAYADFACTKRWKQIHLDHRIWFVTRVLLNGIIIFFVSLKHLINKTSFFLQKRKINVIVNFCITVK